jgi:hypothetical protein
VCCRCSHRFNLPGGATAKIACSPATASTCARVQADDFNLRVLVTGFTYKLPTGTNNGHHKNECGLPRPDLPYGECCYIGGGHSGPIRRVLYPKVVAMGFQRHYAQLNTTKYTQFLSLVTRSVDGDSAVPIGVQSGGPAGGQRRLIRSPSLVRMLKRASVLSFGQVDHALAPGSPTQGLPRIIISLQLLDLRLELTQKIPHSSSSQFLMLGKLTPFVWYPAYLGWGPLPMRTTERVPVALLVTKYSGKPRRSAWTPKILL